MSTVAAQELHANTHALLHRVAAGEEVTITVDGRPVATLSPVQRRPRFTSTERFIRDLVPADRSMLADIQDIRGDESTDDLPW